MTSDVEVAVIGAGQSGLTAARALLARGISPVLLEAGPEPVGSWPHYYDSLTLFSPVAYSSMPGLAFPGHPDHYPHRDEVVSYLRRYAAGLDADIRTNTPVTAVEAHGQDGFLVRTGAGETVRTRGVVAATGSFGHPHTPVLPGQDRFTGRVLHVASYRNPHEHAGERIVVVGAGNSAVQVGYELAQVATVSLATRHPVIFVPQCRGGQDVHLWLKTTGFDLLPPEWLRRYFGGRTVDDTGKYQHALETGQFDRRPCSPRSTPMASSGRMEPASKSTPCSSLPATVPTWTTSARWAPSTVACRCTPVASRPPIPASSTSG